MAASHLWRDANALRTVLSGLAPLPLADEGSVGYRAASHRGVDENAVLGMRIGSCDGATRAHRPGLPPVPRTSAYLNNRLEQDHRGIKGRYRPMRGFKCP